MKYNEISELKIKVMGMLEKAVDDIIDQIRANEFQQMHKQENMWKYPDVQPGYFDAKLYFDFPTGLGTNGSGFEILCNPSVILKDGVYATSTAGLPVGIGWGKTAKQKNRELKSKHAETPKPKSKKKISKI